LLLQSRWKLPTDTNWTLESPNPKFLKDLNRNGNKVTVEDGFCWDSDISIISYQLTYESASGDESATVTIDIPRPE